MSDVGELAMPQPLVEGAEGEKPAPHEPSWNEKAGNIARRFLMLAGTIAVLKALTPDVAEAQYEPLPVPGTELETGATGEHQLAVIPVDFSDGPDNKLKFSQASIDRAVFSGPDSVSEYYSTVSFGQLSLVGTVFQPVTVSPYLENTLCEPNDFLDIGRAANQAVRQDMGEGALNDYSNYMYVFPRQTNCINGNDGRVLNGQTIGNATFINSRDTQHKGIYVHELGHEFGLSHADAIRCRDGYGRPIVAPLGTTATKCVENVYQDPFDPMGFAALRKSTPIDFDAFDKARAGWLQPGNILTVTETTTVNIAPDELPSDQPELIRIPFGRNVINGAKQFVYLDDRQPIGEDAKLQSDLPVAIMFGGVAIRESLGPIGYGGPVILGRDTYLLDTQPQTRTMSDAVLTPGRSYHDPTTGMTIKTLGITPEGAEVRIKIPAS